jgi:ABC transporter substrate binding protein
LLLWAKYPWTTESVADPVGAGFVDSLARPGGNATGFILFEYGISCKWLELLKEIAPGLKRAAVLRDPAIAAGPGQFGAIQSVAPSFGVELSPFNVRDAAEIERAVTAFARSPNGGLIVTGSGLAGAHRDLIITLAARHKLPAVYYARYFVIDGGLISYGPDIVDLYRRAAGLRRPHPQGREAGGPAGASTDQVRISDQPQDRQGAWPRRAADAARDRRRGDRITLRFVALHMSANGIVSRVTPVHTAVRNCTRDEGGPFEVGNQVLISSHRKLPTKRGYQSSPSDRCDPPVGSLLPSGAPRGSEGDIQP